MTYEVIHPLALSVRPNAVQIGNDLLDQVDHLGVLADQDHKIVAVEITYCSFAFHPSE